MGGSGTKIRLCIDTLNLNKRRLSVGLTTIEEYLKQCDDIFYELNKDRKKNNYNQADSAKKN